MRVQTISFFLIAKFNGLADGSRRQLTKRLFLPIDPRRWPIKSLIAK